jgi:hypothetical protein
MRCAEKLRPKRKTSEHCVSACLSMPQRLAHHSTTVERSEAEAMNDESAFIRAGPSLLSAFLVVVQLEKSEVQLSTRSISK